MWLLRIGAPLGTQKGRLFEGGAILSRGSNQINTVVRLTKHAQQNTINVILSMRSDCDSR